MNKKAVDARLIVSMVPTGVRAMSDRPEGEAALMSTRGKPFDLSIIQPYPKS